MRDVFIGFVVCALVLALLALLTGCAPSVASQREPEIDHAWRVSAAQQIRTEGSSEVWLVLVTNLLPETAMVRVDVHAYDDNGDLAGWGTVCRNLEPGRHALEVPVNVPDSMRDGRAMGRTTVRVRSVWLGEFGAGIQTCRLMED